MTGVAEMRTGSTGIAQAGDEQDGVGGRQPDHPATHGGGGYQNICTGINFQTPPQKNDARILELQRMGLQKQWIEVAEKIGVDNMLIVWRTLDSDSTCHADDGRLLIPLRKYKSYERYQRNRYIESLSAMGLSARQIQAKLAVELCEKLHIRNILRIASGR